ncbi:uncharacterized zinc protease SCO5738 [Clavibacter sp.]|nr:uncharacterized zinc protease SCO5738 [Clavibacter sp.]
MTVRRTVLASGLRIVTEEIPTVRSAAFGIWVNVGSRDESLKVAGASHFLEHLLFKEQSVVARLKFHLQLKPLAAK